MGFSFVFEPVAALFVGPPHEVVGPVVEVVAVDVESIGFSGRWRPVESVGYEAGYFVPVPFAALGDDRLWCPTGLAGFKYPAFEFDDTVTGDYPAWQ